MIRLTTVAMLGFTSLVAGCNMTDNGNGSTTISIDENRIEAGTEVLANETAKAGDAAANALHNAGPEIKQSASDIKERAGRVADKVDNLDVDVDVDLNAADNKPAPAKK